jgi:hypothetical protein
VTLLFGARFPSAAEAGMIRWRVSARPEAVTFPVELKIKVESNGQECPLQTTSIRTKVEGDRQECPSHTIENPHFSQKTREMGHPASVE